MKELRWLRLRIFRTRFSNLQFRSPTPTLLSNSNSPTQTRKHPKTQTPNENVPQWILIWQTEAAVASATDEFLWMRRDFHVNPKPLSCWLVWRYARPRNLATGQSPAAIVRRRSASWRETSSRQFQPSAAVLRTWPVPDTKTTFVDTKKHKRSTFSCFSCAVKTAFVSRASD